MKIWILRREQTTPYMWLWSSMNQKCVFLNNWISWITNTCVCYHCYHVQVLSCRHKIQAKFAYMLLWLYFLRQQRDGWEEKQQEGDNLRPTALLIIFRSGPDNIWPSMRHMMHGGFDRAHLCTVQSVALWRPCLAYRLWSSAGTGRHRSPHLSHTPAPQWQRWREGRWEHMLTPYRPLKHCLSVYTVLQT